MVVFVVSCGSSPPQASPDAAPADAQPVDVRESDLGTTQVDFGGTQVDLGVPEVSAPAACGASGRGSAWAVWNMVEPGARKFDTSVPEVVSDPGTGLMWQRKAAPQQLAWADAEKYCACLQLAGRDDWHLPTRMELLTIVDWRRQEPSIDLAVFPDTPNTWFWTSSLVAGEPQVAWYLSFMDGNTHEGDHDREYGVRCVRGQLGQRMPYQLSAGTVGDPNTRLTWQQTLDGTPRIWEEARTYCAGLSLAGGGWRLPTMAELQSLIDESVKEPAIDGATFPNTPNEGFWADTPLAEMPPYRWFVSFDRGIAYNAVPEHLYNVRCVR